MLRQIYARYALILLAASCVSCATVEKSGAPVNSAVSAACCKSTLELPVSARPEKGEVRVSLSPKSPHFDFGEGLAPFMAFEVSPEMEDMVVELRAQTQDYVLGLSSTTWYVPAVTLIFLDSQGRIVPSTIGQPLGRRVGSMLKPLRIVKTTSIPINARRMVVTTDQRKFGQVEQVPAETPGFTMPVAGTFINYEAGIVPFTFHNAAYGELEVLIRARDPSKR